VLKKPVLILEINDLETMNKKLAEAETAVIVGKKQ